MVELIIGYLVGIVMTSVLIKTWQYVRRHKHDWEYSNPIKMSYTQYGYGGAHKTHSIVFLKRVCRDKECSYIEYNLPEDGTIETWVETSEETAKQFYEAMGDPNALNR